MQSHMGLHTGERPYGCTICGKAFETHSSLQDHIEQHSEETIHRCSVCGKGCKTKGSLRKHELRHGTKFKLRMSLSDRLKFGHKGTSKEEVGVQAIEQVTSAIQDFENVVLLEVECPETDLPDAVSEQVVLTTIDPSQILEQHPHILQLSEADGNIIQDTYIVTVDESFS